MTLVRGVCNPDSPTVGATSWARHLNYLLDADENRQLYIFWHINFCLTEFAISVNLLKVNFRQKSEKFLIHAKTEKKAQKHTRLGREWRR